MCTLGRKKTEQENKIKTTIKHRKKTRIVRAKKEEKEKIVKYQQELPGGVGRHLKIVCRQSSTAEDGGKFNFIHQPGKVEYIAIMMSHISEDPDC